MWLIVIIIPLTIAWWVATDARKRGYSKSASLTWFLGVWLALIIFLPLYLILRPNTLRQRDSYPSDPRQSDSHPSDSYQSELREETRVCPYCEKLYQGEISYCPYCGQRLDEKM